MRRLPAGDALLLQMPRAHAARLGDAEKKSSVDPMLVAQVLRFLDEHGESRI
jgi:hypothetical protein